MPLVASISPMPGASGSVYSSLSDTEEEPADIDDGIFKGIPDGLGDAVGFGGFEAEEMDLA